jgi:hypothetical protein
MRKARLIACVMATSLAGCISVPPEEEGAPVRVGSAPASVVDLRAAKEEITLYDRAPSGAKELGIAKAIRCHRYPTDTKPTESTVRDDLMISALAMDANGISDINIVRQPGNIATNCWFRYFGTAKALSIPPH